MNTILILVFISLLGCANFASATSICDFYSTAKNLSNNALVSAVVSGTVGAALGSPLKQFFDGTTPAGSTNFTSAANSGALTTLEFNLVQFFGGALGCTDGTITTYTGPSMQIVHQNMPITLTYFQTFCSALLGVMGGFGVSQTDLNTVNATLQTTLPAICNQPGCVAATTTTAAATTGAATTGAATTGAAATGTTASTASTSVISFAIFGLLTFLISLAM